MIDPEAAAILHRHKVGDRVTLDLGGKCDPSFGGGPLRLTGEVVHLSDGTFTGDGPILGGITHSFGPTAVFRVQGIDILVVTLPGQMLDLQQVRAFGIDLARRGSWWSSRCSISARPSNPWRARSSSATPARWPRRRRICGPTPASAARSGRWTATALPPCPDRPRDESLRNSIDFAGPRLSNRSRNRLDRLLDNNHREM
jgi:hypothetical protein